MDQDLRVDAPSSNTERKRSSRAVKWSVIALLITAAAGCAAIGAGGFKEPVVRLRDVTITGIGLTGGSVDVRLLIVNPNKYKLDAVKMTYKVDVDSIPLGDGELGDRFVVQGHDSSEVRLPVRFTYAGLGAAGQSLLKAGTLNYRVRGDFTVSTPLGNYTRPYNQTGRYSTIKGNGR
ncbi:MAG: LEA type 2 family protein [Gemmatimonas sp.]